MKDCDKPFCDPKVHWDDYQLNLAKQLLAKAKAAKAKKAAAAKEKDEAKAEA